MDMDLKLRLLTIVGTGIIIALFSLFTTPTYSNWGLAFCMNSTEPVWQAKREETITFESNPLSRLLTTYKVKIRARVWADSEEDRIVTLIYRIYSNDIHVDEITDTYDISSGIYGKWFGPIHIPLGTLRTGENTVRVNISLNSTAPEPRIRLDYFEFHIDSIVITDNFRLSALILVSFTSFGIIYNTRPRKAAGKQSFTKGRE